MPDQKLWNQRYWTEKRMTHKIIDQILKEARIATLADVIANMENEGLHLKETTMPIFETLLSREVNHLNIFRGNSWSEEDGVDVTYWSNGNGYNFLGISEKSSKLDKVLNIAKNFGIETKNW